MLKFLKEAITLILFASVNIANARQAGMIVNAYHFARYTSNFEAKKEAIWFDKKLQLVGFDKKKMAM